MSNEDIARVKRARGRKTAEVGEPKPPLQETAYMR